jgi:hypothetical protein
MFFMLKYYRLLHVAKYLRVIRVRKTKKIDVTTKSFNNYDGKNVTSKIFYFYKIIILFTDREPSECTRLANLVLFL